LEGGTQILGHLLYDPSVVQELNRLLIAPGTARQGRCAMLPHQGKEPDAAAFADPEICRRERHPGIFGFPVALRGIFRLPAKDLSLPVFANGMQVIGKGSHFRQIRDSERKNGFLACLRRDLCLNR